MADFPDLPDEYYHAIAMVAIRTAQLDHHIERVIELALRHRPRTAEFALKHLSADRVVGLMEAVLLDLFPSDDEPIDALVKLVKRVRSDRNEFLHWLWGRSMLPDVAFRMSHRPFREPKFESTNVADIRAVADAAYEASTVLIQWQNHLAALLREASRETP